VTRVQASQRAYFPLLGEPLALDLVNTVVRRDSAAVDLIKDPHRYKQWLDYQRPRLEPMLGGPITEHTRSQPTLQRLRQFRDAVRVVIEEARAGQPPGPQLDAALAHAAASPASLTTSTTQLDPHRWGAEFDTEALLGAFAVATVTLVTSAEAGAIRECHTPGCGLLFMPRHPGRRWCSAWTCGNRSRVARHYQNRRVPQQPPA
jgi:predicted RNA-binding Zn ribbon-like protein